MYPGLGYTHRCLPQSPQPLAVSQFAPLCVYMLPVLQTQTQSVSAITAHCLGALLPWLQFVIDNGHLCTRTQTLSAQTMPVLRTLNLGTLGSKIHVYTCTAYKII